MNCKMTDCVHYQKYMPWCDMDQVIMQHLEAKMLGVSEPSDIMCVNKPEDCPYYEKC